MRVSIWLSLVVLSFCSCRVYNDASHPYALAPEYTDVSWTPPDRILEGVSKRSLPLPQPEIHEDQEYSLAEILDLGLLYNTQTKETWAKARAAAAQYGQKLKDYFILSEYASNYQRYKYPQPSIDQSLSGFQSFTTLFQNQLLLSYTFLDFGQTRYTSDTALYALYEADWTHNHEIQRIIQLLMNDYFNVLFQDELLESYYADVEDALITLESAEEKLKTGVADISDVLQAKTLYLDRKLKVVTQEQTLNATVATLNKDMGIPSNIHFSLQGFPSDYTKYEPRPYEELLEMARSMRPDYLAALSDVESKEYAIKAAKSRYYPTLNGSFMIGNTQGNNGYSDTYDFDVQVQLTLPLFQGFFQQNEIKLAKAHLATSEAKLMDIEVTMTKEINVSQNDVLYALDAIDYASQYLEAAQEDFTINLDKYKQGTNTIIDVINALTSIADARAKVISAKRDYFQSLANLSYAIGSLNINPKTLDHIEELNENN